MTAEAVSKLSGNSKTPKVVAPPPEIQICNKAEFRNKTAGEGTRKRMTPKVDNN